MSKPNGSVPPPDPTLAVPAIFINDFRYTMGEQVTRVALIEGAEEQGHIRSAVVLPTPVIVDLAKKLIDSHNKIQARAKIVLPAGANRP